MRRALALLPMLALTACATRPTLDERLATFVGRSELELVSALGVPTRHYETGGEKFLQYDEQRTVALPGGFAGGPFIGSVGRGFYGGGFYGGGFVGTTYAPVQCDVTFALREGRVSGYSFRGQGCA
ncbi:hypothetical protein [Roseomonas indoligenes]|uniref:Lipoprotein n=1 Tax=Roseomonas indoligenes TaxID=2820811 RepID=A0A940MV61_9PROT|nr:hypothetical protein [Pararoseomonas indoligenes]MBP0491334.1 hypothetical protein [Pararoseomonas indoligenes]